MDLTTFGLILGFFLIGLGIGIQIGTNYPEFDNYHFAIVRNVDK